MPINQVEKWLIFIFKIELKLSKLSAREKSFLIESSLSKFRLDGGTCLKLLSGGEKRKLSLASEVRRR